MWTGLNCWPRVVLDASSVGHRDSFKRKPRPSTVYHRPQVKSSSCTNYLSNFYMLTEYHAITFEYDTSYIIYHISYIYTTSSFKIYPLFSSPRLRNLVDVVDVLRQLMDLLGQGGSGCELSVLSGMLQLRCVRINIFIYIYNMYMLK